MNAATRCLLLLPMIAMTGIAGAGESPRWELGAGIAVAHLPDYRGADEARAYALPLPYFVYRGERLRADRDGVRGKLFESDRIELNVSVGLAVPVRSQRNDARRGMARLDPVLEAGPSLNLLLSSDAARNDQWRLHLPLRAAFAFDDLRARHTGVVFSPRLGYSVRNVPWIGGAILRAAAGPNFASRDYHGYTYDVPAAAATANRPAYHARGGYSGLSLSVAADRSIGAHRLYAYAFADSIRGAAFDDSPLVRRSNSIGAGLAYFYVLASGGSAPR